jgi:hypothetical protein
MSPLWVVVSAAATSCIAYTVSNVAQVYWLNNSSMSLYGQFIFFLCAVSISSLTLLAVHALRVRDVRILLPDHDERQRRLFFCTLCRSRPATALTDALLLDDSALAPPQAPLPPFAFRFAAMTQTELLFLMGLSNAAASILQWYSTPPTREPPLLNSVIPCLAVVFSVPLSKVWLADRKKYGTVAPLLSFFAIALGCVVSLLPATLAGDALGGGESQRDLFLWTLVNIASQLPSAGSLVLIQAYLMRSDALAAASGADAAALVTNKITSVLRFVLYNQMGVAFGIACLWWLDIVPWFGSEDLASLRDGVSFAFSCSLGLSSSPSCAPLVPLWALLGVAPYTVYLSCIALIAADSAVFGNVVQVVQTILQSSFFLIPGTNPNAAATPVWSTLVSVALSIGGVAYYKVWESAQGDDAIKTPTYPGGAAENDVGASDHTREQLLN